MSLKSLLLQALDLDRSPTREELEIEIGRCKGSVKRKGGYSGASELSWWRTEQDYPSPPSRTSERTVEQNLGKRLGGLETALQHIMSHLNIPPLKAPPEEQNDKQPSSAGNVTSTKEHSQLNKGDESIDRVSDYSSDEVPPELAQLEEVVPTEEEKSQNGPP